MEELDALLYQPIDLHCIGGFVAGLFYGLPRPTGDINYVSAIPHDLVNDLQEKAGPESALARKHKVNLQYVGVTTVPEDYEKRGQGFFLAGSRISISWRPTRTI